MAQAGRLNSKVGGLTSGTRAAVCIVATNSALVLGGVLLLGAGRPGWTGAIVAASVINTTLSLLTVGMLSATVNRTNKAFISVAGGGPLLRLSILGAAFYLWSLFRPGTLPVLAISSVVLCSACLVVEIAYAAQGLSGMQPAERDTPGGRLADLGV